MSIFTGKSQQNGANVGPEGNLSLLGPGVHLVGELMSTGVMRIEGRVNGTVICKSRLVVGANGRIEGNIDAQNATIEGEVHGRVIVRDLLDIQASGKIYGDIVCEKFTMQAGGLFTGTCKMGPEAREILSKTAPKLADATPPKNLNAEVAPQPEATPKPKA